MSALGDAAVAAAEAGLKVFPLKARSKEPRTTNGFKSAGCNPGFVAGLWGRLPDANIGLDLPPRTVVIDIDAPDGAERVRELGLPPAATVTRTARGLQGFYRLPEGRELRQGPLPGVGDLKIAGSGYVLLPPSVHPDGAIYAFVRGDLSGIVAATQLSDEHVDALERLRGRKANGSAPAVGERIPAGQRRSTLLSLAGSMRRRGLTGDEIAISLQAVNSGRCVPPLEEDEVLKLAADVAARYPPDPAVATPTQPAATTGSGDPGRSHAGGRSFNDVGDEQDARLDAARAVFGRWLHLPDTGMVDVVLAAVAANRLDGDPVWLLLVGPPGGGKSEVLYSISGLPDAHPAATLTEAALLSGTPKRDKANDAKGGLLRNIGEQGIIVCKDFGSVLSMNRDARSLLLAALREVYDGAWTRHVGTDGGRTLAWAGRVGLVGGCTPTIDRHHAVMGAMGERFALYRLPEVDPDEQAREALRHAGVEQIMRAELAAAADAVLARIGTPRERTADETDGLIALATFVVRARSAVERDGYSREIELVPGPEAPTRLAIVLARLLDGLDAIGCDRDHALAVVTKTALDSIPALRFAVLATLHAAGDSLDTNMIAEAVRHPAQTTRRSLEDLVAHRLVECERQGDGKAHRWALSTFARQRMNTFPEMSSSTRSGRYKGETGTLTFRESPHPATNHEAAPPSPPRDGIADSATAARDPYEAIAGREVAS